MNFSIFRKINYWLINEAQQNRQTPEAKDDYVLINNDIYEKFH